MEHPLTVSCEVVCLALEYAIPYEAAKPGSWRVVHPDDTQPFLDPHPVRAIPGVGPVTGERLTGVGIRTVADLRHIDRTRLARLIGAAHTSHLLAAATGTDGTTVTPWRDPQQVSVEHTFDADIGTTDEYLTAVRTIAREAAGRLAASGHAAAGVAVKVRAVTWAEASRHRKLAVPTDDPHPIIAAAEHVADAAWGAVAGDPLRLVGAACTRLTAGVQLTFPFDPAAAAPVAHTPAASGLRPGDLHEGGTVVAVDDLWTVVRDPDGTGRLTGPRTVGLPPAAP